MNLRKLSRVTRRAARYESAVANPGRYARNRATSKALGAVGFWRAMNRIWR